MNLESEVLQVHVEDIIPNRFQPRLQFEEQALKELADSIREHGIIQPLVLRKLGNKYEIIAGERRYKAAQIAGLTTVPAVIANIDDNKSAEVALVENVQRRDLTAIEEARSYKSLLDKGYLTQEQLAKRMGLSQSAISNKLRLLNLDEEVQQALLEEKISERHARTLLTLTDKNAQKEWLHRIINERLTVRQLDLELKKIKEDNQSSDEGGSSLNPILDNEVLTEPETLSTDSLFTTATKVPEFNIATPNSASTILNDDNISSESNKFFNFDELGVEDISNIKPEEEILEEIVEEPLEQPKFIPEAPKSTMQDGIEIFDTNDKKEEVIEEIVEQPTTNKFFDNSPLNTDFDRNPSNKFFTPVTEPVPAMVNIKEQDTTVDPMEQVTKLTPEYRKEKEQLEEMGLKGAISKVRSCIQELGDNGFYVNVEEIDFKDTYQITININK